MNENFVINWKHLHLHSSFFPLHCDNPAKVSCTWGDVAALKRCHSRFPTFCSIFVFIPNWVNFADFAKNIIIIKVSVKWNKWVREWVHDWAIDCIIILQSAVQMRINAKWKYWTATETAAVAAAVQNLLWETGENFVLSAWKLIKIFL